MTKRQIIEREWQPFADSFSAAHAGWAVSLFVDDPFGGREYLAKALPFGGMTIDDDEESALLILAGDSPEERFGHVMHDVRRILVDEGRDGDTVALSVFSSRGPVTVLEFHRVREQVPDLVEELAGTS